MSLQAAGPLAGRVRSAAAGRPWHVWVPLVAGLALVALTLSLGNWQTRRAQEKAALQQQFNQLARAASIPARAGDQPAAGQPLSLEGHWLPAFTIFLDNRTQHGRAGYHVLTPLRLADGSGMVLVNRGWLPADADRSRLPHVPAAPGLQRLEGRMLALEAKPFFLGGEVVDGLRWQYVDLDRYRAFLGTEAGARLAAWVLQQTGGDSGDGLSRDWPQPATGADRHRAYALQWYALAGLAAALTAWYAGRLFTRKTKDER